MVEEENPLRMIYLHNAITVEINAIILQIVQIQNAICCLFNVSTVNLKGIIHVAHIVKMYYMVKKNTSWIMITIDKFLKHGNTCI